MPRRFVFIALLPLAACVVQPAPYYPPGYAYPGAYPAPGYVYSGEGYTYIDGYPAMVVGGETLFLLQLGGAWGYYDRERNWHHAPPRMSERLRVDHPQGLPPRSQHQTPGGVNHMPDPRPAGRPQPGAGQQQYPGHPAAQQPRQQPPQQQHQQRRNCEPSRPNC